MKKLATIKVTSAGELEVFSVATSIAVKVGLTRIQRQQLRNALDAIDFDRAHRIVRAGAAGMTLIGATDLTDGPDASLASSAPRYQVAP